MKKLILNEYEFQNILNELNKCAEKLKKNGATTRYLDEEYEVEKYFKLTKEQYEELWNWCFDDVENAIWRLNIVFGNFFDSIFWENGHSKDIKMYMYRPLFKHLKELNDIKLNDFTLRQFNDAIDTATIENPYYEKNVIRDAKYFAKELSKLTFSRVNFFEYFRLFNYKGKLKYKNYNNLGIYNQYIVNLSDILNEDLSGFILDEKLEEVFYEK